MGSGLFEQWVQVRMSRKKKDLAYTRVLEKGERTKKKRISLKNSILIILQNTRRYDTYCTLHGSRVFEKEQRNRKREDFSGENDPNNRKSLFRTHFLHSAQTRSPSHLQPTVQRAGL
jgi:hypothetical protein